MQTGGCHAGRFAKLDRLDVAARYQLVQRGPPHTDHAGSVIYPEADWFDRQRPVHYVTLSSRYATGFDIQRLIADSRHPAPFTLIFTCDGNVPSAILRYMVERDRPVRARTVFRRTILSGSDINVIPSVGSCWHPLSKQLGDHSFCASVFSMAASAGAYKVAGGINRPSLTETECHRRCRCVISEL